MTIGSLSEQIGTSSNDFFNQTINRITYGLQGNDSFSFGSSTSIFTEETSAFIGGSGSDTYTVSGSNTTAIIFDGSNSSGDRLNWFEFGDSGTNNTYVAQIDGRHLYFADSFNEQYVLLIDWQSPSNRIEFFSDSTGTYTYEQYSAEIQQAIQNPSASAVNYVGNYTWNQAIGLGEIDLASVGLNASTIDAAINQVKARATQLEQGQNTGNKQDLNSDGKTDLFFYNPQFQWSGIAYMDGTSIVGSTPLWNGWRSLGSGDFNKDGNTDIVIQNADNDWYGILYMNGSGGIQSSKGILGWQDWDIIGTGNFNNDGTEDILIRHQTQNWYGVWYMGGADGSQIVGSQGITMWDGWDIKGTGDFDSDGKADLVVQHRAESWKGILYLNESQQIVDSQAFAVLADWDIIGTTDLNNDGNSDVLIEHKTEPWDVVLNMNGDQIASSSSVPTWAGWQITA